MKNWKTSLALMSAALLLTSCAESSSEDPGTNPGGGGGGGGQSCSFSLPQCSADFSSIERCENGVLISTKCQNGCIAGSCKKETTGETCAYSGGKCSDDARYLLTCSNGSELKQECPNGCAYNACKAAPAQQDTDLPKVTGLDPTSGKAGTKVTIKGANLGKVSKVFFGPELYDVASATADAVTAVAPELSGTVMVGILANDKRLSAGTFTYLAESENKNEIDWCQLTHVEPNIKPGDPIQAYAQVFEEGKTGASGSHAGIQAQVGYIKADGNLSDTAAYTWTDAKRNEQFSGEAAGNNDEYMTSDISLGTGKYRIAYRFSLDGKNWQYCDLNGSQDGFSADQAGTVTVADEPEPEPAKVEWCRIMNGSTITSAKAGSPSEHIYAQGFVPECTNYQTHCSSLKAQVGVGSPALSSTDAIADGYTWTDAAINPSYDGSGGTAHDEFMAQVNADKAGTYAIVYRMSVDNGKTWTYCDTTDDIMFSVADAMTLLVTDPSEPDPDPDVPIVPPKTIEWCRIQSPATLSTRANAESAMIYGQVFVPGCTGTGAQCKDLKAQVGFGDKAAQSPDAFTFTDAKYNATAYNAGNNDEFMGQVKPTAAGDYAVVYRFSLDGENWTYCDFDDAAGFKMENATQMTVKDTDTIVWCRTVVDGYDYSLGSKVDAYGQVWVENCTEGENKCASVTAEVGYGKEGEKVEDFSFEPATYNEYVTTGNNDEYMAQVSPDAVGYYRIAYRFSTDNKKTWTYCDADDQADFNPENMSGLHVKDPVEWCQLYMTSPLTVAKGVETDKIYGQAFVSDCSAADPEKACTGLKAEIGYGTGDDVSKFKFVAADYDKDVGYNDEFAKSLTIADAGEYKVVYAFTLGNGERKYCSMNGNKPFDLADAGVINVIDPATQPAKAIKWCQIVSEDLPATMTVGSEHKVYAQALVDGCTDAEGACKDLTGYIGYGKSSESPEKFTFTSAKYFKDVGSNDEFVGTLAPAADGDYQVLFAFSTDGGKTKTYCTNKNEPFSQASAQTIKVTKPADLSIEWCRIQHPQNTTVKQGETSETIYGQVLVPGCSEKELKCGAVMAEAGYGTGKDLDKYTWTKAVYNELSVDTDNDEYGASFAIPKDAVDTTYNVVYRFSIDKGKSWTYCDFDDKAGFDLNNASKMKVEAVKVENDEPVVGEPFVRGVDFSCGIDNSQASISTTANDTTTIYGQIWMPGCTDNGKCAKIISSHFHYIQSPMASQEPLSTSAKWIAVDAKHNDLYSGQSNDEYMAQKKFEKGSFAYAYSFDLKHDPSDAKEKAQRVFCFVNWAEYGFGSMIVQ
ncbi:MAG: IPT/TIG domain-containing protein [Proteobacteria bacterium]|nr:IPT/TIG domain-containing protein [Pseudomonadota bacterium]